MKEYMVGAALLVILSFVFCATVDINRYLEQNEMFDSCIEDAANSASLYYDYSAYAEGKKVFLDNEAVRAVDEVLSGTYTLGASSDRYLNEAFNRYVTIYDDSLVKREYINGVLQSSNNFTYGIQDTDRKGKKRDILSPTIIVYVDAGHPMMQLRYFRNRVTMTESAAYVYQTNF